MRAAVRSRRQFTSVTWRRRDWKGSTPHVALLLDDDGVIRWLGRAEGGSIVSDRDRRVNITELIELDGGLAFEQLVREVPKRGEKGVDLGLLPEALGSDVLRAFLSHHPGLEAELSRLGRPRDVVQPDGNRSQRFNEQRDGTGLLLDISGIGREPLRDSLGAPDDMPSFLSSLPGRNVSEETLINHDISILPGMAARASVFADWNVFESGRNRIFIANTNMEPLETALGVDVIYFNQLENSFITIQYKRMKKESAKDGTSKLWYRPEKEQLQLELARMRAVDEMCEEAPVDDFRFYSKASWMKLCDPSAVVEQPQDLIKGMYLPRGYFEALLDAENLRGPKGGRRLGYDNVKRHLTNTSFIELVKTGWIGTHGASTDRITEIVRRILDDRRAVVLGVQTATSKAS